MTQTTPELARAAAVYLSVRIGGILHAIPIESIEEVLPALPIEPISQLPSFVIGVVFVRGHLIPVLSGVERLGLGTRNAAIEPQLVCLRLRDRLFGLEVDEAIDLIELPFQNRLSASELGASQRFLSSIVDHAGQVFRILDPTQLLQPNEFHLVASEAPENTFR
ncbi:chemotaxis protein CheW [Planctomicrobium sp. SH661]|uniref:chemotaxis protein CheW n=1 Tax=Planctomicrobium sp. SH661 TaxID=3448124 RepID=UPI003F5AE7FE